MSETEYTPEIQKDCFGWNEKNNNCSVLREVVCKKRKCSFYKTKEQHAKDSVRFPFIRALY